MRYAQCGPQRQLGFCHFFLLITMVSHFMLRSFLLSFFLSRFFLGLSFPFFLISFSFFLYLSFSENLSKKLENKAINRRSFENHQSQSLFYFAWFWICFPFQALKKRAGTSLGSGPDDLAEKLGLQLELAKTTCRPLGCYKQKLFECLLSLMSYISSERWPKKGFYDLWQI